MSRRTFSRTLNGEIANIWRGGGAQAAYLGVTSAHFGCTGTMGTHIHGQCSAHRYTCLLPYRFRTNCMSSIRATRHQFDGTFGQQYEVDFEIDKEFVVKGILEKVDHVFNSIGVTQEPAVYETSQSWYSMEGINVEWPRMLARWSREMGVERLVHMSRVGADHNSPSKLLRQMAAAEEAVLTEFPRATIIRSTDIFAGQDDFYTRYFKAQARYKITPVANKGNRIHQPAFAGDIGEAAARAILLPDTAGRIAELGGPVRFTTNDLLRFASECNDQLHLTCHIPRPIMEAACWANERLPIHKGALIGVRAPYWNQDWLERQFIDNVAMPERDPELLDWEDFGIPREDLFRLEERYFLASMMWSKMDPLKNHTQKV